VVLVALLVGIAVHLEVDPLGMEGLGEDLAVEALVVDLVMEAPLAVLRVAPVVAIHLEAALTVVDLQDMGDPAAAAALVVARVARVARVVVTHLEVAKAAPMVVDRQADRLGMAKRLPVEVLAMEARREAIKGVLVRLLGHRNEALMLIPE